MPPYGSDNLHRNGAVYARPIATRSTVVLAPQYGKNQKDVITTNIPATGTLRNFLKTGQFKKNFPAQHAIGMEMLRAYCNKYGFIDQTSTR